MTKKANQIVETGVDSSGQSKILSIRKSEGDEIQGHTITSFFFQKRPDITAPAAPPPEHFNLSFGNVRCLRSDVHPTRRTYDRILPAEKMPLPEYFQHATATLDLMVVLSGTLTLLVGHEKVDLHPGDVVIQRGARHAWHNYTDQVASFFIVMIGAEVPKNFQAEEAIFPHLK